MTKNVVVLYTTIGTQQEAENLARLALSQKLAACVNIMPEGKSIYLWNGEIERNSECYMLFKTTTEVLQKLEQLIIQKHSYDVPVVLKFTPEASEKFADYIYRSAYLDNVND